MKTKDAIKFMEGIYTVIDFIQSAQRMDERVDFILEDQGEKIIFSIQRGHHNILCEEITKIDEDSLKVIYAAIAAKYSRIMKVGALCTYNYKREDNPITYELFPVIGDKASIRFISDELKDQKWFYEEIEKSTKGKGLK